MAGDLLDLQAALAPCVAGYAEIGDIIRRSAKTVLQGNPYALWIENYGGDEYRGVANAAIRQLNRSAAAGGGEARYDSLLKTFRGAVQLETAFWGMGWAKR
jgi:thiaminase/transcriptional activator TenA